jgi:hypothetical protein
VQIGGYEESEVQYRAPVEQADSARAVCLRFKLRCVPDLPAVQLWDTVHPGVV